jgi:hypothetical protein
VLDMLRMTCELCVTFGTRYLQSRFFSRAKRRLESHAMHAIVFVVAKVWLLSPAILNGSSVLALNSALT